MSIVIASLEANSGVRIFADRKIVHSDSSGRIYATDEIKKVYLISDSDTIACGFTGDAQWGITLAAKLINSGISRGSELIKLIKRHPKPEHEESTFTLIGLYDNGLPFIFGYKTLGKPSFILNETAYCFATSPEEYLKNCSDYFSSQKKLGNDLAKCSINTIKFASQQNPDFISETHDSIEILYKPI
jgi:hypothetical protein